MAEVGLLPFARVAREVARSARLPQPFEQTPVQPIPGESGSKTDLKVHALHV